MRTKIDLYTMVFFLPKYPYRKLPKRAFIKLSTSQPLSTHPPCPHCEMEREEGRRRGREKEKEREEKRYREGWWGEREINI